MQDTKAALRIAKFRLDRGETYAASKMHTTAIADAGMKSTKA